MSRPLVVTAVLLGLSGCGRHAAPWTNPPSPVPVGPQARSLPPFARVGSCMPAAGKHETHREADIGKVAVDDAGVLVAEPAAPSRWGGQVGYVVDGYSIGGAATALTAMVVRGRHAFGVTFAPAGDAFHEEKTEFVDHNTQITALEGFRLEYRQVRPDENWLWLAGVAVMRIESVRNDFPSMQRTDETQSPAFLHGGIGWRFPWSGGGRVFSQISLHVMVGPETTLPEEYRGDHWFVYGPVESRASLTVVGATF